MFSLGLATVGVLEATNWVDVIPDGPSKGWTIFGIALVTAWLRVITTGPVGKGHGDDG